MDKKGIRYLRYSSDKQSFHSIERQDAVTSHWMNFNNVVITDTFVDEGHTARNFDRPDIKELFQFIKKNYKTIDFLVVSELTRFSREAGDAINMVKKIQTDYGVRIVSAGRGAIYDCMDHNSFFMMGLEFLMGNSENIKRQNDIRGGIYAAKAIKGLWIQGGHKAPYGYTKIGSGSERRLVIDETQAYIVRYIFEAFLNNTPIMTIYQDVRQLGFSKTGNSAVQEILTNPIYAGYQNVKAWKEQPGGLFPMSNHTNIIEVATYNRAQEKLQRSVERHRVSIAEDFPLRGVLRCHCQKMLTGAPSKGRHGKYYNYYKCNHSGHNNLNANKIHDQLLEALKYMSLPSRMIKKISSESEGILEKKLSENGKLLMSKRTEISEKERQLHSIEAKWINNEIKADTYQRWHTDLSRSLAILRDEIKDMNRADEQRYMLLKNELQKLSDLATVYSSATIPQKHELLRKGFDNGLYYKNGLYRTPYMMEVFHHSTLILSQKKLLEIDENKKTGLKVRSSGGDRIRTGVQTYPSKAFYMFIPELFVGK